MNADDETPNRTDDEYLLARLHSALEQPVPPISPERLTGVRSAAVEAQPIHLESTVHRGRPTRRDLLLGTAAATLGAVGGAVIGRSTNDEPAPTTGPPTEAIRWTDGDAPITGATVAGKTINHTWGVELLLDTTGFPVGDTYSVVYVSTAGDLVDAGGFVGAELPIHCRCNGALLRDAIAAIEIRDASGRSVSRAEFT